MKRIKFDTWLGHLGHRVFRGRFDHRIKSWYDNKYPIINKEEINQMIDEYFKGYNSPDPTDLIADAWSDAYEDDLDRRYDEYITNKEEK